MIRFKLCILYHAFINETWITELKRIYEIPIIKKFRLNRNFPKSLLYARKSFLELGLITPKTTIDILALKGYFENKRVHRNVAIIIDMNEQYINQVSGVSKNWDEIQ